MNPLRKCEKWSKFCFKFDQIHSDSIPENAFELLQYSILSQSKNELHV